jgi:hypothetical protein
MVLFLPSVESAFAPEDFSFVPEDFSFVPEAMPRRNSKFQKRRDTKWVEMPPPPPMRQSHKKRTPVLGNPNLNPHPELLTPNPYLYPYRTLTAYA